MKKLLIVESPAKAKTLGRYLGSDYQVLASYGHIRDLVPKNGAVDPEQDFLMTYEIIEKNEKHVLAIKKALKSADQLLLATDPDREGEAISWHLLQILLRDNLLKNKQVSRVVFHEITKKAILNAVANPRDIAMDLVNSQQARRALDYLVGFNLSPLLWRKIQRGLSAGRVQSPALRMIVEREREIESFVAQEHWKITAQLTKNDKNFTASLIKYKNKKVEQFSFVDKESADGVLDDLNNQANGKLQVLKVETKERKKNPAPPFITSTLQQEAARKLRFSVQRTMRVAQKLYEEGLISYMRTDSVYLAQEAVDAIRNKIAEQYGADFLPKQQRAYSTKSKNAQEAHEAIRPTDFSVDLGVVNALGADEGKLFDLIYKRTLASQMKSAVLEQVSADLQAKDDNNIFRAVGSCVKFAGFMLAYLEDKDDQKNEEDKLLPAMHEGEMINLQDILASQHFTQPPPRFGEASLIKALEEKEIGRPSTYVSIISTLLNREYVELDQRRFLPTMMGKVVNDFLTNHFAKYVDYDFTANLENQLDAVSRGEKQWKPLLKDFWLDFKENIDQKQDLSRESVMQARELGVDPKSGKQVVVRFGRYGAFVQIGAKDDEEKPRFASLLPDESIDKITLEKALSLFTLPKELGKTEDGELIVIKIGRFGPYIDYGKKYASIPKGEDPFSITLERAFELIELKKAEEAQKYIKEIPYENQVLNVLNGRFGPYVTDGVTNASIPKSIDPAELDLEKALELLEKSKERKAKKGKNASSSKTVSTKKVATKKAASKTKTKK